MLQVLEGYGQTECNAACTMTLLYEKTSGTEMEPNLRARLPYALPSGRSRPQSETNWPSESRIAVFGYVDN